MSLRSSLMHIQHCSIYYSNYTQNLCFMACSRSHGRKQWVGVLWRWTLELQYNCSPWCALIVAVGQGHRSQRGVCEPSWLKMAGWKLGDSNSAQWIQLERLTHLEEYVSALPLSHGFTLDVPKRFVIVRALLFLWYSIFFMTMLQIICFDRNIIS